MFGKGKIELSVPRTNYAPGDIISGTVNLTINKPVKARGVNVLLVGEQTTWRTERIMQGDHPRTRHTKEKTKIYEFDLQLDVEKEYTTGGEYSFEIAIPADILACQDASANAGGVLGALRTASQVLGGVNRSLKWYLQAKLDIPRGIDIKKNVQITIG